jgi:hypothetical protein
MTGNEYEHNVIASFISDNSGFPLTGLKRSENSIVDMDNEEFEQVSAILPQIWEAIESSSQSLEKFSEEGEVNHLTIGFKKKDSQKPHLEMMITRLEELYLSSIYYSKK